LHIGGAEDTLHRTNTLKPHVEAAVSEILGQAEDVEYLLAVRVIKHGLSLEADVVGQAELSHNYACLVGAEAEHSAANFVVALVRVARMVIDSGCKFETCTLCV
jgi:hypothetical protein